MAQTPLHLVAWALKTWGKIPQCSEIPQEAAGRRNSMMYLTQLFQHLFDIFWMKMWYKKQATLVDMGIEGIWRSML